MNSNGHKTQEEDKAELEQKKPPRPARRRQEKKGREATGIKLSKAEIYGITAATQQRDSIAIELQRAQQVVNELYSDRGLDSAKSYFIDQDGSVYLEPTTTPSA